MSRFMAITNEIFYVDSWWIVLWRQPMRCIMMIKDEAFYGETDETFYGVNDE